MGLTISRQLVELMKGTIGMQSETGIFARFWFEIPLKKVDPLPLVTSLSEAQQDKIAV